MNLDRTPRAALGSWLSLCRLFLRQDLTARFQGNAGGVAWAVLAPLLQLGIFFFVFTQIFKARVEGLDGVGYLAFLALGFWPWFAFSEAVARATTTLQDQAGLVRKVAVPVSALVMARVLGAFLLHGVGFVAVLIVLGLLGVELRWLALPLVALLWVPLLMLASGLALMAAATQVFIRDLAQAIGLLLSFWFFMTPIIYSRQMIPDWLRPVMDLNPMTGIIEGHRLLLLGMDTQVALLPTAFGVILLSLIGFWVFRRCRPALEEFL